MASTLMFWNKQNSSNQNGNDAKNTKNGRNWLHAPDVLVNGHVAYLVKVSKVVEILESVHTLINIFPTFKQFLGSTPVEQAKGIEVVKEAIRRLQFTQQMKKAEGGSNVKTKKVEITISVDGVAIQVCYRFLFIYDLYRAGVSNLVRTVRSISLHANIVIYLHSLMR